MDYITHSIYLHLQRKTSVSDLTKWTLIPLNVYILNSDAIFFSSYETSKLNVISIIISMWKDFKKIKKNWNAEEHETGGNFDYSTPQTVIEA